MISVTSKREHHNNQKRKCKVTRFNIITNSFIQHIFHQGLLSATREKSMNKTEKKNHYPYIFLQLLIYSIRWYRFTFLSSLVDTAPSNWLYSILSDEINTSSFKARSLKLSLNSLCSHIMLTLLQLTAIRCAQYLSNSPD